MSLVLTLASRNLFQDRLRFIATSIGIVFTVVLVMVQMGLYLGFGRMVTTMIDHATADLWVVSKRATSFEDLTLLDIRTRYRLPGINGVAAVIPVAIGFADWRRQSDGRVKPVFVIDRTSMPARWCPGIWSTAILTRCAIVMRRNGRAFGDALADNV